MKLMSLEDFYKNTSTTLPEGINKEIGHFNVFRMKDLVAKNGGRPSMVYNRKAYYKISLIDGATTVEYADKTINIQKSGLLFATPKVPYQYQAHRVNRSGYFCIFTGAFLMKSKSDVADDFPIFKPGAYPVFNISAKQGRELADLFEKMCNELASNYAYKYDSLRAYILELIHVGQKLHPGISERPTINAADRISVSFIELLERQFPIESPEHSIKLRTPNEYADQLSTHINHLNKLLKDVTGKTTTELISERIVQEAKILLKQTDWSISQISSCLGFREVAHFSNFFKKQTAFTPLSYRS
jgi:AraC family transcriptional regulator, transcriptional activator of pobA